MKYGSIARAALASAALCVGATGALAGDNNGNFMVRVQGTYVVTQDDVKALTSSVPGVGKAFGDDAEVSDEFIPTLTLTYFMNKNVAVELFCCFAKFDVDGKGTNLGPIGKVADTWAFPPILTLQYHFDPVMGIKPYVGAGVQYIHYFDSKTGNVAGSVDFKDSWGFALQAGLDYQLGGGWYANVDVKKIWLDTEVSWKDPVGAGTTINSKVDIDPLIISAGVGYRFNLEDIFGSRSASVPMK